MVADSLAGHKTDASRSMTLLKSRLAGLFYLTTILSGAATLALRQGLFVRGDAAATSANLLAHEPLYRLSLVTDLASTLAYVFVTMLLYELLAPAGRGLSRAAAGVSLTGCAIGAVALGSAQGPLILMTGAPFLQAAFTPAQLQGLSLALLRLHNAEFEVGLTCFGIYCFLLGVLIARSGLLPRICGLLLILGSLAWETGALASIAAPAFASLIAMPSMLIGFAGEAVLALCLLTVGVKAAEVRPAPPP